MPDLMMEFPEKEIAKNLWHFNEGNPELLGTKCLHCQELMFPARLFCSRGCDGESIPVVLGSYGFLWTWTIQRFPPKPPYRGVQNERFRPYGVGYIDLPIGIRVESRLVLDKEFPLSIGQPMKLVIESFPTLEGEILAGFAFKIRERSL